MFRFVCLFRFHALQRSYGIFLSLSDLFHLAYALTFHPCWHKWQYFIILWLMNSPLYIYTTVSIHSSMNGHSEVTQSCPTLCDPMECSPPGSSVHGIHQTRILEWVAISFSRGSSQPRDGTQVSYIAGRCFNLWAKIKWNAHKSELKGSMSKLEQIH